MPKKRTLSILIHAFIGLAACLDAAALGFGRAPQTAVLGQPLDFVVELRLDAGDTLGNECVTAEVVVGDHRVPPSQVRARIESRGADSAALRVSTSPSIDEPVVAVNVVAGCGSQVSRRFVLLADPPSTMVQVAAAPMMVAVVAETTLPPMSRPDGAALAMPGGNATTPPDVARPPRPNTVPDAAPATPRPAAERKAALRPKTPPAAAATARKVVASVAAPIAAPAAGARLQLDAAEPLPTAALSATDAVVEEAIAAVAAAASAARSAAEAASASARRIESLEQSVQTLRAQVQSSQQEAALLRARGAPSASAPVWLTPLLLALAALAGLVAWLVWRLRALQAEQRRAWLRVAAAEASPSKATAPIPLVTSELDFPPSIPAPLVPPRPAWPAPVAVPVLGAVLAAGSAATSRAAVPASSAQAVPPASPAARVDVSLDTPYERTDVLPPNAFNDDGAPRDVSIDELLDLEQQADFFVVLGQDDAAIELLVDHLRVTGGGSPLPYLKLLEIYRRLDDHEAYERTRSRFNDRFNAYAPEWAADLQAGRTLDGYPGVLPRLQQVWPRPLDAMAELEALLFRKSRGELFDLPAYREVLFLYSLARDLLEREPPEAGHVDLLLPLADGSEFGSTSPAPFMSLGVDDHDDREGGRPTAPLDLDLDLGPATPRASLFERPGPR